MRKDRSARAVATNRPPRRTSAPIASKSCATWSIDSLNDMTASLWPPAGPERLAADRHDAALVGKDDGLHAVSQAELHQHPGYVSLDCGLRHEELLGDLHVRQTAPEHHQDLSLAWRQRGERRRGVGDRWTVEVDL